MGLVLTCSVKDFHEVHASTGALKVWLHHSLDSLIVLVVPPSAPVAGACQPPFLGLSSLIGPRWSLVGAAKVALPPDIGHDIW